MVIDPVRWQNVGGDPVQPPGSERLVTGPGTDWFADPAGGEPVGSAPLTLTRLDGDFQLRALVEAPLSQTYDAVALFVHGGPVTWAKLALERSPASVDTIVTVVTRDVSDDANGVAVARPGRSWLRISRTGAVYAFHHSPDGGHWSLDRLFTLGPVAGHRVGFCVQSPTGAGLSARVSGIAITPTAPADPRDGS
jgi:regulation of enolase protein 1 (concanavalin A-like superfamily)